MHVRALTVLASLSLSAALPMHGAALAQDAPAPEARASGAADGELPIRRVVLYKHGIGYFERLGTIHGDAEVRLSFRESEMSDVLKTLTALDLDGGRVSAIGYDSKKPASKVLEEFSFSLPPQGTQQRLLSDLRGAHVRVAVAGRGVLSGRVLGFDTREVGSDGAKVSEPWLSLLQDSGGIASFEWFDVTSLEFTEPALQAELERYLATLRESHVRDSRAVRLHWQGEGEREAFVAYALEQPVWKATYRIVLRAEKPTLLQGYAIVDNASDEDWRDVRLSLVAGLPVSFRQDLYTPRYVERPSLDPAQVAVFERRREGRAAPAAKSAAADDMAVGAVAESKDRFGGPPPELGAALEQVQAEAAAREIGDLLEYVIDHPVTIERNRSALLPIVAAPVEGGRVSLYDPELRARNPMAAVRLVNGTGLSLEAGPVTVLEEDTYAGEAQLEALKPGELRYVPFAVDLSVKADTREVSRSERVHAVAFHDGLIVQRYWQEETRTYAFENLDDAPRAIVVIHPRRPHRVLRAPERAFEEELERYRFRVEAAPKSTVELVVKEAYEQQGTIAIGGVTPDQLALLIERGVLNERAQEALHEVIARKSELAATERALADAARARAQVESDQDRLRKNLGALKDSEAERELRRRFVDELAAGETRIAELDRQRATLEATRAEQQRALDETIRNLSFEYVLEG